MSADADADADAHVIGIMTYEKLRHWRSLSYVIMPIASAGIILH